MERHKPSLKERFLRRSARSSPPRAARRRRLPLHLEQLESRLLMDGAGFVNTDPEPDPDSVVGVAVIEARDDYVQSSSAAKQLRIDVLRNDPLPEGSEDLQIKSVSETLRGATVTISDDGKRLIYTPPASGLSSDSFYYIVEDSEGNLGKANVTVTARSSTHYTPPAPGIRSDSFTFLEDSGEKNLPVLRNDGPFRDGEIIDVSSRRSAKGTIRIADDGKSLFYQPAPGGGIYSDYFTYTVRKADGETASTSVSVRIEKPFAVGRLRADVDINSGPIVLNAIAKGKLKGPTPEVPRVVEVTQPQFGGDVRISDDGQQLIFEPVEDFIGSVHFNYTVRYGPADYQRVAGSASVVVNNTFLAVDNWFAVETDSTDQLLDVLANDPTLTRYTYRNGRRVERPDVTLAIVDVSAGDQGGQIAIDDGGAIRYTPADGFKGQEKFSYVVEDSTGHRDSATVTVHVADGVADPVGVPKFILPGELEQFLIDQAVERFKTQFGLYQLLYVGTNDPAVSEAISSVSDHMSLAAVTSFEVVADSARSGSNSHSQTNTQEAGVDEADIVETDGRYIYTFSHGKLVIADLADPHNPMLVSFTEFDDRYAEMYLQGDRMTLINRGGYNSPAVVTVLDVSDRTNPTIIERTEIDGTIIDSRAVGDRVYVTTGGLKLPEVESHAVADDDVPEGHEVHVNETLDEYVARVRESLIEFALPSYRTFDADGELLASGLLTDPAQIHKPIDEVDNRLVSLVTFDVADDVAGPLASTGIFTTSAAEIYMSGDSFYVMRNHDGETTIFKFEIAENGTATLVATGKVGGTLLNQFAVDEHDGHLRIATTQTVRETYIDAWGRERVRQQRRFNNLFVLEQTGTQLEIVGSVENLAPTETIKSVRFLDDRAYVVTFRVVDPLFAVDLSDPTNPTVEGSLKIPGFSDYLHPVGEDYVIGIGRDANEITGRLGPVQITLFYVGDLSNPSVVDQVTMEGVRWSSSEAWNEHHAVAYFAEDQVLTIPVSWTEPINSDDDNTLIGGSVGQSVTAIGAIGTSFDLRTFQPYWGGHQQRSAIWAFEIKVDQQGGGSIEVAGSVEHEGEARRSVRLGDSLVTISQDYIKVHELDDLEEQNAELFLGRRPVADQFTIQEDSEDNVLDVLANDHPGSDGQPPSIVDVTQPTEGSYYINPWNNNSTTVGEVEIADDGRSLIFTSDENFFGTATFTYTVFDELRGEEQATVTITVENVPDDPEAVNDEFDVKVNSGPTHLNVLANDINVDSKFGASPIVKLGRPIEVDLVLSDSVVPIEASVLQPSLSISISDFGFIDVIHDYIGFGVFPQQGLTVTAVGPTDHGGTFELNEWGQLIYTPAADFEGVETFTYTIETQFGLTDVGAVTVRVGTPAESSEDVEEQSALVSASESEAASEADPRDVESSVSQASGSESQGSAPDVFIASLFDPLPQGVDRGGADGEQTDSLAEPVDSHEIEKLPALSLDSKVLDRALSSVNSTDAGEIRFTLDDDVFDSLAHDPLDSS